MSSPQQASRPDAASPDLEADGEPTVSPQHWRRGFQGPARSRTREVLTSTRDFVRRRALAVQRYASDFSKKRTTGQKVRFVLGWTGALILGLSVLALYSEFFHVLVAWAKKLGDVRFGWLLLWALIVVAALPPAVGYSTLVTLAGLVYGVWLGWVLAATATVVGSSLSFAVSRYVYGGWVRRKTAGDARFTAFALVLKHDGLKLLCMIRLCPLPYSFANGAIATVPTVSWAAFTAATALVSPKILSAAFIGSRLAAVADDDAGGMTATETAVNYLGIALTLAVAGGVAWYVYRRTMARARQLEAEGRQAAEREGDDVWLGEYADEIDDLDEYGGATELDAADLNERLGGERFTDD